MHLDEGKLLSLNTEHLDLALYNIPAIRKA